MQNSLSSSQRPWQNFFTKLSNEFTKNKQYILYKYLPSSLMLLLSAYIHNFLRGVKDSILVPSLGPELISFIKFYGVFPGTLIFFLCFTKLANILARDKLYYAITLFFCGFFMLYAFVLSPFQHLMQPDLSDLMLAYPKFKYHLMMIQHWTTSLVYIMCEICGTVMLALLFWQFTNELYSLKEAKKTYALFGVIGQVGIVIAGLVQTGISEYLSHNVAGEIVWDLTLKWMMSSIMLAGLGLIAIYRWLYKNVFFDPILCTRQHTGQREKITLSIKESLKYICSSRYLWLLMIIVFSYGVAINLVESSWKYQLKQVYPTQNSYSIFMGKFTMYFGFFSIATMFLGAYILHKFKWLIGALLTPIGAGITGAIFFTSMIFQDWFEPIAMSLGSSILLMSVMMGSVQLIFFKSLNYTFDVATREMAYMPLDRELRTKGKAAVDVIGNRGGKAFGAIAQQLMFQFISPSIGDLTHEIFLFFALTITIWILSVFALSRRFIKIADHANH
jgi:AAA family ATP:ADP antiporter